MPRPLAVAVRSLVVTTALGALSAQAEAPASRWEFVNAASGVRANPLPVEVVVWSQFVIVPAGTPWLRLHYHAANLDPGSYLRITSVLGGHTMTMRQEHLAQWRFTSCFFNGAAVLVELVAGPNTTNNHVDIQRVLVGDTTPGATPDTICGSTDNRAPSTDPRSGRIDPIGCTGWIVDYPAGVDKIHLSAGHCLASGQVLQFDVPASIANCSLTFPPPAKQFAIDNASSVAVNGGPGNDYWAFRCFTNPTTGRTTFEEQGAAFTLAAAIPGSGSPVRVTGFGIDGTDTTGASGGNASCSCTGSGGGTRNQVQQTHASTLNGLVGNRLDYQVDTCGGNSGSPVINDTTGQAIGIHTHGGCSTGGGNNSGTSILHGNLQTAIQNVAPPAVTNDDCATARPITVGTNGPFRSIGASTSTGAFPCGPNVVKDLWFAFNSCGGVHTFSTCTGTRTFDTVLQVFSGSCGTLTSLGCNDDAGGGCSSGSSLTVSVPQGVCYLRVGGANLASGFFDIVVRPDTIYENGPFVTHANGGAGGAPASLVQTGPPYFMTELGFEAAATGAPPSSVAEDFVTNGTWCVHGIEVFAFQTGATAPSLTGVFLEFYDGDPATTGQPIVGSPGFANNLFTMPGHLVSNTMTGVFRALDTAPTTTTAQVQSVFVGLPAPLLLDSSALPGGRYWLRMQFTGSQAAGPAVVPIAIPNLASTGDGTWDTNGMWLPLSNGGYPQGVPFQFYGNATSLPGGIQNLGGGCAAATLSVQGAPHIGGALRFEMTGVDPLSLPLIALGVSDPNTPFAPLCGCVQHASLDFLNLGNAVDWLLPTTPAGLGLVFYTQGVQLFGPALACDLGLGFRLDLTDAFRVRLY